MRTRYRAALVVLLLLTAGAAGIVVSKDRRERAQAVERLWQVALPDPQGAAQRLDAWRGRVVVVNFWATWCAPCQEEVPTLVRAQKELGKSVQIVGIAVDSAAKVRQFARDFGINYPLLIGGAETMDLVRHLGNKTGGLPFTLVLDRDGSLAASHLGIMRENDLTRALRPLLSAIPTSAQPLAREQALTSSPGPAS